jgi:hypothetical protein
MDLGRLDNIHPLPIGFKDILPKELKAIPVNLNGTPGRGINQFRKITFQLLGGQLIRATIKVT